jgi:hypothetical protein
MAVNEAPPGLQEFARMKAALGRAFLVSDTFDPLCCSDMLPYITASIDRRCATLARSLRRRHHGELPHRNDSGAAPGMGKDMRTVVAGRPARTRA